MYIYLIIKLILELVGVRFKFNFFYWFLFFEGIIIINYLLFLYYSHIKFEFNKDIEISKILNFNDVEIKELDFKIISINSTYQDVPLVQHFLEVFEDLELLMIKDLKDSRYFFLFED